MNRRHSLFWPGKKRESSLFLKETNQEQPNHTQIDEWLLVLRGGRLRPPGLFGTLERQQ